jgi:hypothetical protein
MIMLKDAFIAMQKKSAALSMWREVIALNG